MNGNVNDIVDEIIVACQRGGVSIKPPDLRAATRHGPVTL